MNINNRLRKVSEFVSSESSFLDIGCDHAFLDIYLAKNKEKNFKKIVASDNKKGPLDIARKNIKNNKLQDKIELRLGNGLDVYTDDINTIVISGMGGRNIIGIFKYFMDKISNVEEIILSPNNYQKDVRKFLCKNGFYVDKEELVKDNKIIYQVMKFKRGKERYNYKELYFGPELLKNRNNIFNEYYARELASKLLILKMLPKGHYMYKLKLKLEIKLLRRVVE